MLQKSTIKRLNPLTPESTSHEEMELQGFWGSNKENEIIHTSCTRQLPTLKHKKESGAKTSSCLAGHSRDLLAPKDSLKILKMQRIIFIIDYITEKWMLQSTLRRDSFTRNIYQNVLQKHKHSFLNHILQIANCYVSHHPHKTHAFKHTHTNHTIHNTHTHTHTHTRVHYRQLTSNKSRPSASRRGTTSRKLLRRNLGYCSLKCLSFVTPGHVRSLGVPKILNTLERQ